MANINNQSSASKRVDSPLSRSLKITLIYFTFSCLWILLSDIFMNRLMDEYSDMFFISITKGYLFVAATSILIFGFTYPAFKKNIRYESKLRESERSKSMLLSNLPGMAYRCLHDREWTMQFVSKGCYELTGYKPESYLNNAKLSFNDSIAPEYRNILWNSWNHLLDLNEPFKYEYEIITAGGVRKWVLELGQGIYDEGGNIVALEGIIIDITDRKEKEQRLRYLSEHDRLTGLYNLRYFEALLNNDVISREDDNRAIVLLNLQKINSFSLSYGYDFSERTVKELASILSSLTNINISLFHISFGMFAFYYVDYMDTGELSDFCNLIIKSMEGLQTMYLIGCGIGIHVVDKYTSDFEGILKNAAIAANFASINRAFGYCFFENELKARVTREADIKNELIKAAYDEDNVEIYLQYQPIVDTKSSKIKCFEALSRIRSESLGIVSPDEFIPIAEETQLIVQIGQKIMKMALRFLKDLETAGYGDIRLSVNVSAIELLRDEYLSFLTDTIEEYSIEPCNLELEITESVFSDNFNVINEKLEKINQLGITIAVDDFGTGYSSLAREKELNVNCLKIDKYFIDNLLSLSPEEAITSDIISMAHKLGHSVIAEGVENEIQRDYLINHNCDMMQGYLFSRPVNQEEVIKLLEEDGRESVESVLL